MKTNKANANTRKNTKTSKGKTQNPANVETAALQSQEMTAVEEQSIVEDDAVKMAETASAEIVGQGAADVSAPAPASEPEAGVAVENVDAVALLPAHAVHKMHLYSVPHRYDRYTPNLLPPLPVHSSLQDP